MVGYWIYKTGDIGYWWYDANNMMIGSGMMLII